MVQRHRATLREWSKRRPPSAQPRAGAVAHTSPTTSAAQPSAAGAGPIEGVASSRSVCVLRRVDWIGMERSPFDGVGLIELPPKHIRCASSARVTARRRIYSGAARKETIEISARSFAAAAMNNRLSSDAPAARGCACAHAGRRNQRANIAGQSIAEPGRTRPRQRSSAMQRRHRPADDMTTP